MSQELVKASDAPKALTLPQSEAVAIHEAFAINVGSGAITEFDLQRIKIMNGAAFWLIPKLEGEETAPSIEGVIVYARDIRAYYATKDAGNVPPDCSSRDAITGVSKPEINLGGECAKCPMAVYGSAADGDGQACKQMKQLFMLRGESIFPEVVSLPPTSVKSARQFFLKLASQGVPYYHALVQIPLEKAQNGAGQVYGKASLKFVRRLSPSEAQRAVEFHDQVESFITRVPITPAPEVNTAARAE
jgi:hypothetical protein